MFYYFSKGNKFRGNLSFNSRNSPSHGAEKATSKLIPGLQDLSFKLKHILLETDSYTVTPLKTNMTSWKILIISIGNTSAFMVDVQLSMLGFGVVTYPTFGKGKASTQKCLGGDILVPRKLIILQVMFNVWLEGFYMFCFMSKLMDWSLGLCSYLLVLRCRFSRMCSVLCSVTMATPQHLTGCGTAKIMDWLKMPVTSVALHLQVWHGMFMPILRTSTLSNHILKE